MKPYAAPACIDGEISPELWNLAGAVVSSVDSRAANDTSALHLESVLLEVRLVSAESAAAILGHHTDDDEPPRLVELIWESWWCPTEFSQGKPTHRGPNTNRTPASWQAPAQ
jgi:hypothetical protein